MLGDVGEEVGNDGAQTFRYVYAYFKSNGYNSHTIQAVWEKVKSILILSTNGTMNWNYTIMLAISCAVLENQLELQETLLK